MRTTTVHGGDALALYPNVRREGKRGAQHKDEQQIKLRAETFKLSLLLDLSATNQTIGPFHNAPRVSYLVPKVSVGAPPKPSLLAERLEVDSKL